MITNPMQGKLKTVVGIFLKTALFLTPLASLFLTAVYIATKESSYRVWCRASSAELRTLMAYASLAASVILPLLALRIASAMHGQTGERAYRLAKKVLGIFVFLAPIIAVLAFFTSLQAARFKSRDAKRIADIRQTQVVLELYFDRYKSYPVSRGQSPAQRWEALGRTAVSEVLVPVWPFDVCAKEDPRRQYDYQSSGDGSSYVLRAVLDDPAMLALKSDVDGEVLGIWCGEDGKEKEYCVTP